MDFIPQLFGYILPFLFVLTIVVFFHELGHYAVARWNKVDIEAFSVGFGKELFGYNDKHGTRWKLCMIPLGGYVKFKGDANAASAPDFDKLAKMSDAAKAGSFEYKRVGQRAAVVAAGPIANFILAIVIFTGSFYFEGRYITDPIVVEVQKDSAAELAGFLPDDLILSINGESIASFNDIQRMVGPSPDIELTFVVRRNGQEITLLATPKSREQTDRFGNTQKIGMIGVVSNNEAGNLRLQEYGFVDASVEAVNETWYIATRTLGYLGDIIVGKQSADQLGGPIRIAKVSGDVATLGLPALISLAAILSISIGLLNLFPVPLLDGGHLVFYAYEAIMGKPLSQYAQEIGFRIGLAAVLMLMVFATWNDVTQLLL
ncbi:MAG: RIP metalloprotease RseP [Rhizobiaceae bacterium]